MASSWVCISFRTSGVTAVEPCIRPADCWMTCWDTSNTAMTVLAITIRDKLYDGRFSSANKAWAQAFPIEPDIDSWGGNRNLTLVVRQTHPGLLNLFCDQAKAYESEKVSVREKLKAAAKNAPVPSTKKEMER